MTQDEIVQGNKLIMEFDGWKLESRQTFDPKHNTQNPGSNTYYVYCKDGSTVRVEDVPFDIVYHQSWNALMPVVEKISLIIGVVIESKFSNDEYSVTILKDGLTQAWEVRPSPILAHWLAITYFLRWYNTQKPFKG